MTLQTRLAHAANYKAARRTKKDIGFIVLHYTGNRGDTARNNAAYFATGSRGVSAHYFVDETEVWQSVPDACVAWHCGTRGTYYHPACRNSNSIGIEICLLDAADRMRQGSLQRAAALTRELMQAYGVPIGRVVRHYDVTHKICPAPLVQEPALWAEFKKTLTASRPVCEEENEMQTIYETRADVPDWARECVGALLDKGYLQGEADGRLSLEHHMLRGLVINWRAGLYG